MFESNHIKRADVQNPSSNKMETNRCPGNCHRMQRLWNCQQREEFCDLVFETERGERVSAHRVVLASCSPVIYNMLSDQNTSAPVERTGTQTIRLPGVSLSNLQDIIRFSYLGNIEKICMETYTLWERFQILEPIRLMEETPNLKDTEIKVTTEENDKIKTEDESDTDEPCTEDNNHQDNDYDDDTLEEDNVETVEKETVENNTEPEVKNENTGPTTRRGKRKSYTPRQRPNRVQAVYKDEETSDEETEFATRRRRKSQISYKEYISDEDDDPTFSVESPKRLMSRAKRKPPPVEKVSKKKAAIEGKVRKRKRKAPPIKKQEKCDSIDSEDEESLRKDKPKYVWGGPADYCKTCGMKFDTVKLYREHRQTYHYRSCHKCIECGESFNRGNLLKAHRIEQHFKENLPEPRYAYCKYKGCNYRSVHSGCVDSHYKNIHVKERVICETCGASFAQPYSLTVHIKRKHEGLEPTHKCDECEYSFHKEIELNRHKERVHLKTKNHMCDQCPFMAFNAEAVTFHMFSKHGVPLPGKKRTIHSCPHCEYKTVAKNIMVAHLERHENRGFKCDKCESVFQCNRDLNTHRRLKHTDRRVVHKCPHEGCKFATVYGKSPLRNHILRMHTAKDFKPWACEVCDYRSNVKGNLHLHLRKVHKLQPDIRQKRLQKIHKEDADEIAAPPAMMLMQGIGMAPPTHVLSQVPHAASPVVMPSPSPAPMPSPSPISIPGPSPINMGPMQGTKIQPPPDPPKQEQMEEEQFKQEPVQSPVKPTYHECPPNTYQTLSPHSISRPETAPVQVPTTCQNVQGQEPVQTILQGVPFVPGGQFGMMVPPVGYDENMFIQGFR